jgi:hypothetical protein
VIEVIRYNSHSFITSHILALILALVKLHLIDMQACIRQGIDAVLLRVHAPLAFLVR